MNWKNHVKLINPIKEYKSKTKKIIKFKWKENIILEKSKKV